MNFGFLITVLGRCGHRPLLRSATFNKKVGADESRLPARSVLLLRRGCHRQPAPRRYSRDRFPRLSVFYKLKKDGHTDRPFAVQFNFTFYSAELPISTSRFFSIKSKNVFTIFLSCSLPLTHIERVTTFLYDVAERRT